MKLICFASLLLILLSLERVIGAEDQGIAFYREVLAVARGCAEGKSGSAVVSCYVRASPQKCETEVYEAMTRQGQARSSARRAWAFCVASCLDAGLWSRSFGECSRELR